MARARLACLLSALVLVPVAAGADSEVQIRAVSPEAAEALRRYRDQRMSSAYYDPSGQLPDVPYGPTQQERFGLPAKKNAHASVKGYKTRSCGSCHEEQALNSHTVRANTTCRQCHGGDPIASSDHYFSPMNPIRRHAYVCAKCHEGAGASFATYVVHEAAKVRDAVLKETFPALYWADVFMVALIVSVLLIFLPHGVAWWIREWFVKRKSEA